jgi:hypothetical protein
MLQASGSVFPPQIAGNKYTLIQRNRLTLIFACVPIAMCLRLSQSSRRQMCSQSYVCSRRQMCSHTIICLQSAADVFTYNHMSAVGGRCVHIQSYVCSRRQMCPHTIICLQSAADVFTYNHMSAIGGRCVHIQSCLQCFCLTLNY